MATVLLPWLHIVTITTVLLAWLQCCYHVVLPCRAETKFAHRHGDRLDTGGGLAPVEMSKAMHCTHIINFVWILCLQIPGLTSSSSLSLTPSPSPSPLSTPSPSFTHLPQWNVAQAANSFHLQWQWYHGSGPGQSAGHRTQSWGRHGSACSHSVDHWARCFG